MKIRDLPENEKPLERLFKKGAQALSDKELLAVVINTGGKGENVLELSEKILVKFGTLKNVFEQTIENISQIKNISIVKAAKMKAVQEISMRIYFKEFTKKETIHTPQQAFNYIIREITISPRQENLIILALNARGNLIGHDLLFKGSFTSSIFNPREIFHKALEKCSVKIILAHNHPSGDLQPSQEDIMNTHKVIHAGEIIGIKVLDHLVFSDNRFLSMKQMGCFPVESFLKGGEQSEYQV